jgi:hypothetical protein
VCLTNVFDLRFKGWPVVCMIVFRKQSIDVTRLERSHIRHVQTN